MAKKATKKHSPEQTASYNANGMDISVLYSSPSKKDRVIFGELVPYNKVWRTGANEPTKFTCKTPIKIMNKDLAAGEYSLWTIPSKDTWIVIINKNIPGWGVTISSGGSETARVREEDVLAVTVPVKNTNAVQEKFTIAFEESPDLNLSLSWDKTKISVPISN